MVHGWIRRVSTRLVSRRKNKGEAPTSLAKVHGLQTSCWDGMQKSLCWRSIWVTKHIPWNRRRRLGMAVAGNMPTASFLINIGKMQSSFKNLQQGRAGREDTGNRGDHTSQRKSRGTVQLWFRVFFHKSFLGQAPGWVHNQCGNAHFIYFGIETVNIQGRGDIRGGRSRSKRAAQNHHQCAQSCCSEVENWAD